MLNKLTIRDIALLGRKVFIRVDFNVPLNEHQEITDDTRIRESIATIRYAVEKGARVILASHLGRPKGKVVPQMSLAPAAKRLSEMIGKPVRMAEDCIGPDVERTVASLANGEIVMLENLRFHIEEEKNDPGFAKALADLCDVYVNDAFGTAHRAHASTEGITHYVSQNAAGFLMEKELEYLGSAIVSPAKPYVVVLGGAKVSTKLEIIDNLLQVADRLLIGGGMCFTFLKAMGKEIGASLLEADMVEKAAGYLQKAKKLGKAIDLPVDVIAAASFSNDADHRIVPVDGIPAGWMGLDIGPETIEAWKEHILAARTVLLNGPMGAFEMPNFSLGTNAVIRAIAASSCVSIVGGGDTVAALESADLYHAMSHVSTGGGASLEFLGGRKLPGLEALTAKKA